MTVSKEALNKTAEVGNLTEFLITVKNIDDIHLKDVFVKEGKHDGLEYVSYNDPSGKWTFDGVNKWSYDGYLEIGESANFTVIFKVIKSGNLTNFVTAGSNNTDNVTDNACVPEISCVLTKLSSALKILLYISSILFLPGSSIP